MWQCSAEVHCLWVLQGQPQPGLGGGFSQLGGGMGMPGMVPQHFGGLQVNLFLSSQPKAMFVHAV